MRVLFAASDNNFTSGAFRSMTVLNHLLNTKHNVETLVVLPNDGDGQELLDSYGVKHTFIKTFNWIVKNDRKLSAEEIAKMEDWKQNNVKAVKKFVELINEFKPDIIHINTSYHYVAAEAAALTHTPIIWHLREFLEEDQARRFYEKDSALRLIGKSDKIITISKALYDKYQNYFFENKLTVVYNGISTEEFYKPDRSIFQNNKLIFICVGGVCRKKGHYVLLEAIGKLRQSGLTNFELWLVGTCSPHMEKEARGIAKKYGFSPNLKLLGRRNDVAELLEKADVAFMCSEMEAFGRVSVEAMLSGCLLIAANKGGTTELVKDKKTGLLYEQASSDDLFEKIQYAIRNKSEMRQIARKGRKDMFETMSAQKNATNIYEVYKQVLSKKKVTAVVTTYNRKNMLLQCIEALRKQTYTDLDILVVDNDSTDGTGYMVKSLKYDNVRYLNTGKNLGGAGGFHVGIKEAYLSGAKWVWVMDDDVIPKPNALEELINATKTVSGKASFFASCVLGKDNSPMNVPGVDLRKSPNGYPFWYKYLYKGIININAATFVSILINHDAIAECGFPCKDFFIWGDDSEYTKRIYRNYGNAYMVGRSKVIHMREGAADLSLVTETNKNRINLYYYYVRNTLTYTQAYASKENFKAKLSYFKKDLRKEIIEKSPCYNKEKLAILKKGINDFLNKKYDWKFFDNRLNIYYGYNKTLGTNKGINQQENSNTLFKKGKKYLKDNGLKKTVKKVLLYLRYHHKK